MRPSTLSVFVSSIFLSACVHARPGTLAEGEQPAANTPAAAPAPTGRAALPASPTAWQRHQTEPYRGKQDDIFFINPDVGWYVNGAGRIFKTTDAGKTWIKLVEMTGTYFRCIAFLDENTGFAGNIGPGYFPGVTDAAALYRTDDGGTTWHPVTTIEGPALVGLCALEVVRVPFINAGMLDHRTRIVGVGRVGGPAACIMSDDLGKTWRRVPLPDTAAMAFDAHFFDDKHGVVAAATSANVEESKPLILTTDDAGVTWREAYTGTRPWELTWKISFPTRQTGYVTIQSYNPDKTASARFIAKTGDGGKTWTEVPLVDDHAVRQFGVAFVDEKRGWIGAMPGGFETSDGGETWQRAEFGNAVNKIRVLKTDKATWLHAVGVGVFSLKLE